MHHSQAVTAHIIFLAVALMFVLPSCALQRMQYVRGDVTDGVPLFIEMPESVLVFQDLSNFLYDALWNRFRLAGYCLQTHKNKAFRLKTKFKQLDREAQLVSLDVITYGFRVRIEVDATLYDPYGKEIDKTTMQFFDWVDKAKEPPFYFYYLREQYERLLVKSAPKLDFFVRCALSRYGKGKS